MRCIIVGTKSTQSIPSRAMHAMHSRGSTLDVEATALATLALLRTRQHPEAARKALTWLSRGKGPSGTWGSTQATILAMKALLAGTGRSLGGEDEARVEVAVNEDRLETAVQAITTGAKESGGWGRIFLAGPNNVLDHVKLLYGADDQLLINGATATISNSEFSRAAGDSIRIYRMP